MPLWGKIDRANNAPKFAADLLNVGSGNAAKASNTTALYNNVSVSAFTVDKAVGIFSVSEAELANTNGESRKASHQGWQLRTVGTGPISEAAVNAASSGHRTGDTITVSGGSSNATITITANATGNMTSLAVTNPGGGFSNQATATVTFNREKHVTAIVVGGTPTGYSNTDYITVSNGISNATATLSTNSTGGFVTANVTVTQQGSFLNSQVSGNTVVTVFAANGAASAGTGGTFTPTLANSTGGSIFLTLGGRAGRTSYETLVAFGQTANSGTSDDTQLPQ